MVFNNLVCAVLGEEIPVSKEFIPKLFFGLLVNLLQVKGFGRLIKSCEERSGCETLREEVHEARGEQGPPDASR